MTSGPDLVGLRAELIRLRGDAGKSPDAVVILPVNARADLQKALQAATDIAAYQGKFRLELIAVVNNYPAELPPAEIDLYRSLGMTVIAIPKIEHHGAIVLAARIPGIRASMSENVILFDSDCRIPNATALIDWYMAQFEAGAALAYTPVDYFDMPSGPSARAWLAIHHLTRWFKRVVLRVPTSRGSNYAIRRSLMLDLYENGDALFDIKVGPAVKARGGRVSYSGDRRLVVLTSGRNFSGGWAELWRYLVWRVGYYRRRRPMQAGTRPPRNS